MEGVMLCFCLMAYIERRLFLGWYLHIQGDGI